MVVIVIVMVVMEMEMVEVEVGIFPKVNLDRIKNGFEVGINGL